MQNWWTDLAARLHDAGAAIVGVADVGETVASDEWREVELHLRHWLENGEHGEMRWLARPDAVQTRLDPRTKYPWIRSAVVAAFNYNTLPSPDDVTRLGGADAGEHAPKVSRYAHGTDYHDTLETRLKQVVREVGDRHDGLQLRWYVDTGPVLERQWAEQAGVGWRGKNTLLIHPQLGSWLFLAVIFASEEAPADARQPVIRDHCGTCTACIDACPTDALDAHGKLDARRCLSYLTIEARDDHEPRLLAGHHEGWLFGCDICQQVCPWNRKAPLTDDPAFAALPDFAGLSADDFAALTDEQFRAHFRRTPLWRPRREKLQATLRLLTGLRQAPGVHATSDALARHIVRRTFDARAAASGPNHPAGNSVRVLDPAVGDGVFLRSAADEAAERGVGATLFGVDIEPTHVDLARRAAPDAHLRVADSLDRATWADGESYDVVLMNPPWLSYGNRQSQPISADRRAQLRRDFALGFAGFPSSHGPFIELASDLAGETGWIGMIVPEQVAHLPGYRGAREALLRRHALRHIERVGESMFDGVTEPAVILIAGPRRDDDRRDTEGWLDGAPTHADADIGHATPESSAASLLAAFDRHPTFADLAPKTFTDPGVHTGGVARQIIRKSEPEPDDDATWEPCRRGSDVRHFRVLAPSEWLRTAPPADVPPGVTKPRWAAFERYAHAPLLLRQTADRPIAALHGTGMRTWFRNSVLAGDPSPLDPPLDPRVLAVLLNSAAVAWLHRTRQADARQRTQPQVKLRHLRALPCPPLPDGLAEPLIELADAAAADEPLDELEPRADELVAEWLQLSSSQAARIRDAVEPWSRLTARGRRR